MQKATTGGLFVFFEHSTYKLLFGIIVGVFWFGVGAAVRPFPTRLGNVVHDIVNFAPILFLVSGVSLHLELSDQDDFAATSDRVLLWTCSLGTVLAVLANMINELVSGDWRDALDGNAGAVDAATPADTAASDDSAAVEAGASAGADEAAAPSVELVAAVEPEPPSAPSDGAAPPKPPARTSCGSFFCDSFDA